MGTASDVLSIAAAEIGYDRFADPERGTKYGRWYEAEVDRSVKNYDYGANGVAYCAMFVSWVLAQANVDCAGFPSAYCPYIHRFQHLTADQLRPGDIVLFDWGHDCTDDHVGIVESNDGFSSIRTIEGNVNNGKVMRKLRPYASVCGGIRPSYDGAVAYATNTVPAPAFSPGVYRVTASALNVRNRASTTKGKVLSIYPRGRTVTVTTTICNSKGNTWGRTPIGWIAMRYKGKSFVEEA